MQVNSLPPKCDTAISAIMIMFISRGLTNNSWHVFLWLIDDWVVWLLNSNLNELDSNLLALHLTDVVERLTNDLSRQQKMHFVRHHYSLWHPHHHHPYASSYKILPRELESTLSSKSGLSREWGVKKYFTCDWLPSQIKLATFSGISGGMVHLTIPDQCFWSAKIIHFSM